MKKFFKILGITLASVVGLVVVAVAAALAVVFTPKHLTKIVGEVASDYISCEYRLGEVELTFFSTFPEFGLRADGVLVLNPTEGAQSDTLLAADMVVARFDLKQLLQDGCLNIHEVALQKTEANIFIAEDGTNNYDVLNLPPDTVEEDTTAGFIRSIRLEDLRLTMDARRLTFVDKRDTIAAAIDNTDIALRLNGHDENVHGKLDVQFPRLSVNYKGVDYASDASIALEMPFDARLVWADTALTVDTASLSVEEMTLKLNRLQLTLNGTADVIPEIHTDLALKTNTWNIGEVLQLIPDELFTMPDSILADGNFRLNAQVRGTYNDSVWPKINGRLRLMDVTGSYQPLPYALENVQGDATFALDLNRNLADATIHSLTADVRNSSFEITGQVKDILRKMWLDLAVNADVSLPDADYFLPKNTVVKGKAAGTVNLNMALDDLTGMQLTNGTISADLNLTNLNATMDSMSVRAPKAGLAFAIPNTLPADKNDRRATERRKNLGFLSGKLRLPKGLDFTMTDGPTAHLEETTLQLQLSDILNNSRMIYADADLTTSSLAGGTVMRDSLGGRTSAEATLQLPTIHAYVEYDTKDTTHIPTLSCDFAMERLQAQYDTIKVDISQPKGKASLRGEKLDKTQPLVNLSLRLNALKAQQGQTLDFKTDQLALNLRARHSDNKENILLEWNPQLHFDIKRAVLTPAKSVFEKEVRIPEIKFAYSNKVFNIDTARVELGNSNFALSGRVSNIGPWLEENGVMTGALNFTSSMTDVDELLALTSGAGSDETQEADTVEAEADPYMVPQRVELTLNTHIHEAKALGQNVHNLSGRLHLHDGILMLEQMGFICKAARLELTAMYRTPRKNHIYTGLDYHMYDINIAELVDLIPQVDTLLPMLRSFKGAAEFHLAAETYLNGKYDLKPSTTRGACSIQGKDLTLMDGETFTKIAKLLTFKKSTENKIDSLSAEITLFKKEVDVYPFLITMDKWMAAVGGQYKPYDATMQHNYHISLLNPLYLGVDVVSDKKNPEDLKIKLAKCKYAKDFKPVFTKVVDSEVANLREIIRKSLMQGQSQNQ